MPHNDAIHAQQVAFYLFVMFQFWGFEVVELDINKRWENGTPHHQKSEELFKAIAKIDYELGGDYFCWKSGGDGDNGEHLMYELDIYFEQLDART